MDGEMDGGIDAGWTVSKILERDGHGKWSKTKDLLFLSVKKKQKKNMSRSLF